ncbi:MAG: chorismate synthase, partial [Clostridia bacterium]|nr:chorismate synthase [Clostridia bacterium]
MSTVWGSNIKITIFGESHSSAIGVVIDNLPAGVPLDIAEI